MLKLADLAVREEFSLGPLWVSPPLRLIRGPTGETHVEPLTMQVFLLLADAKGQVVTRNHLYDECWGGVHVGDYSLNRTITMVRRIAAETSPGAFVIESIPRTGYRLLVEGSDHDSPRRASKWRFAILGATAAAVLGIATSAWFLLGREPEEPTVAVVSSLDDHSTDLAAGISSSAIAAAATYGVSFRLVDDVGHRPTDFLMRIREAQAGNERKIDLTLLSGTNRAILWKWSATRSNDDEEILNQLARDTGGLALSCAAETQAPGARIPDQDTVKLYLDACSKFDPSAGAQLELLADAFEKVTLRAPYLRGAWSKLFLSQAEAIEGFPSVDLSESLKKDMARWNSLHRGEDLLESYIAKSALLPPNARFERFQIVEAALGRYPNNLFALTGRSWLLRQVGRMDEAARTARRLAELYPQSSAAQTEYVNSLMSSGRVDAARHVLESAEKATPHAPNLNWARWRLEMRYGDPEAALGLAHSGDAVVNRSMISFIQARLHPTKANVDRAIREFTADYEKSGDPGLLAQALGGFGRTNDAIQLLLQYDGSRSGDGAEDLFRPHMREVRRDRRFILIAQNFGVTDYWIRSGILPDFCYEPDLPYDCKQELAKLPK